MLELMMGGIYELSRCCVFYDFEILSHSVQPFEKIKGSGKQ
jgi:hypothetical protein